MVLVAKYLKISFREKQNWFWMFGYPILFILMFSIAFSANDERSTYNITIINYDTEGISSSDIDSALGSNASQVLMNLFTSPDETNSLNSTFRYHEFNSNGDKINEAMARQYIEEDQLDGIIIIPANFSEIIIGNTYWYSIIKQGFPVDGMDPNLVAQVQAADYQRYQGTSPTIEILTSSDTIVNQVLTSVFEGIINQIILNYNNITQLQTSVHMGGIEPDQRLNWFDTVAPGLVAVGVLVAISNIASMFALEKSQGLMKRLDSTPVPRFIQYLSGGTAQFIFSSIQVVLLLLSLVIFGVKTHSDANWILAFLAAISLSFACIGLGLIIAAFVKSPEAAGGFAWIIIMPLQLLSGGFFPMSDDIAKYSPSYYSIRALRRIILFGAGFSDIAGDLLMNVIFGVIFLSFGLILFARKKEI